MVFKEELIKKVRGEWTDTRFHLLYLYELALSYPNAKILELGVRDCNTTVAFLAAAEEVDGKVVSVDIDSPKADGKLLTKMMESGFWQFEQTNDLLLETDTRFDIIFIDTSHELYHTLQELRKFVSWVLPGGRIVLHDTEWAGLDSLDSLNMRSNVGGIGPVAWALDEFCRENKNKIAWTHRPGSFGLGELCL